MTRSPSRYRLGGMGEFRAAYFARDYQATVAFYRDGLELARLDSWDRGRDDRGTIFEAGAGRIEILALPERPDGASAWDYRSPQGVLMVVEVEDVETLSERVAARGLTVKEPLKSQPWGHRSIVVADPDGVGIYFFSPSNESAR